MARYRKTYSLKGLAVRRRQRRKGLGRLLAALAAVGVGCAGLWAGRGLWQPGGQALAPAAAASAPAASVPETAAPPSAGPAGDEARPWDTSAKLEATLDETMYTPDWRLFALHEQPAVDTSYFNTATFVGDSLTQGLELYSTGLPNAHYCAYKGTGPNAIVSRVMLTRADGRQEVCLDALVASQPDYVYMLLGTNTLVSLGNDDSFLAYYGQMIDLFQQNLPEGVIYYVQAIPGVRADVHTTRAGLQNDRIRAINSRLAALAAEKNCAFIDLQEALTNDDGTQKEAYGAADGIHYNAEGYQAWVNYLVTHTVYNRRNPYVGGNPFYIE